MALTAAQIYQLNHMNSTANAVQLGTLISDASDIVASEVALAEGKMLVGNSSGVASALTLTSGQIIVGNGSSVAAAVSVTGDVTISSSGVTAIASGAIVNADVNASAAIDYSKMATMTGDVTMSANVSAIGAGKVTEAMQVSQAAAGLHSERVAHGIFDATGGKAIAAHTLGATVPNNAFVIGAWYWVETTFTSATDAATIALHIQAADDVVSAVAISDGSNPWDTTSLPVEGVPKIETTSTFLKTTAARALTATVAVEALTAGKLHMWASYWQFA